MKKPYIAFLSLGIMVGSGALLKLVNNFVCGVQVAALQSFERGIAAGHGEKDIAAFVEPLR